MVLTISVCFGGFSVIAKEQIEFRQSVLAISAPVLVLLVGYRLYPLLGIHRLKLFSASLIVYRSRVFLKSAALYADCVLLMDLLVSRYCLLRSILSVSFSALMTLFQQHTYGLVNNETYRVGHLT